MRNNNNINTRQS